MPDVTTAPTVAVNASEELRRKVRRLRALLHALRDPQDINKRAAMVLDTAADLTGLAALTRREDLAASAQSVATVVRQMTTSSADAWTSLQQRLHAALATLESDVDLSTSNDEASMAHPSGAAAVRLPHPSLEAVLRRLAQVLERLGIERCRFDAPLQRRATHSWAPLSILYQVEAAELAGVLFVFDEANARTLAGRLTEGMTGEAPPDDQLDAELRDSVLGELGSQVMHRTLRDLEGGGTLRAPRSFPAEGTRLSRDELEMLVVPVSTAFGRFEVAAVSKGRFRSGRWSAPTPVPVKTRPRAVIADDSAVIRRTLHRILTAADWEVVGEAANGREAAELFRRHRPDLVTLDLTMPEMSGIDAWRVIRTEDQHAHVLIVSALAETDLEPDVLADPALGYLSKPFSAQSVQEAVAKLKGGKAETKQAPANEDDLLNAVLSHYRIEALLGHGGMGTVYRANDVSLGRPVALKVLSPELARQTDTVVRFLGEARSLAQVRHPNVVGVYFAGSDRGHHFFAMDLLPGPDLEQMIRSQGPLTPAESKAYMRQACQGLMAAQSVGLTHCDIKPANLMLARDGHLCVTDFGLARASNSDNPEHQVCGTPAFMAPELFLRKGPSVQSDIYALGITWYYLLVGEVPFMGDSTLDIARQHIRQALPYIGNASRRVNHVIGKMTDKQVQQRYADYEQLLADVERL